MTSTGALNLGIRLAAVAVAMSSVELIVRRRALASGGLLDWSAMRYLRSSRGDGPRRVTRALFDRLKPSHVTALQIAQLGVVVALVWRPSLVAALLIGISIHVLNMRRHPQSNDGSDDMVLCVLAAAVVAAWLDEPAVAAAFLAGEVALSYFVSGISKVPNAGWWTGRVLPGVVGTISFGHPALGDALAERPRTCLVAARVMLLWESVWPVCLVVPRALCIAIVVSGVMFHAVCAIVMGLNTFVWAFAATYPSVVWTNGVIRDGMGDRADAFAGACLVALLVVVSAVRIASRRRSFLRPGADDGAMALEKYA